MHQWADRISGLDQSLLSSDNTANAKHTISAMALESWTVADASYRRVRDLPAFVGRILST